ncbi:hypothetical protein M422DRAFT_783649 [Sphaerobolus stellatus SS14]|uniref:Fungal-type protein kinase domain-containing protein n=1 Tax=Sphaerobolus stellatus (strain SS14) TaxID=990650 RepID=A0A0C9TPK9_SPHS4|nr:hypothetical protein M422DRAFT_783649 [Sphaerobolus stellatus SS14]
MASRASDVRKDVERDLSNLYSVADTDIFLENIHPIANTVINDIMAQLEANEVYNKTSERWRDFPDKITPEQNLYPAFCAIANAINDIVDKYDESKRPGSIRGRWVNCSAKSPKSWDDFAALIRPDMAFVSHPTHVKDLNKVLKNLHQTLSGHRVTRGQAKQADLQQKAADEDRDLSIWWLQMINAVECKNNPADIQEALRQLCGYVRQILREQVDRRFALGLTLCFDQLNVYLFDRSGVFGTKTSIDINKDPKKLIRAIAAYSMLPPENLGWDPTMQRYYRGRAIHSYKFPWENSPEGKESIYRIQWVIQMGSKPEEPFVTIRTLSLIGAEIMCGRATLVWEVVRSRDLGRDDAEVFVLKQSWQRLPGKDLNDLLKKGETFESFAHRKADLYEDRIYAAEYVSSLLGKTVTTLGTIRKNIVGELISMAQVQSQQTTSNLGSKRDRDQSENKPRPAEHFSYKESLDVESLSKLVIGKSGVVSRAQTRLLMKTRGWPLKYFKHLLELICVIYDAVEDHERYLKAGILHRDLSGGNVIILMSREHRALDSSLREYGHLIDLDHARPEVQVANHEVKDTVGSSAQMTSSVPNIDQAIQFYASEGNYITAATLEMATKAVGSGTKKIHYIEALTDRFSLTMSPDKPLTPDDFHWVPITAMRPKFSNHKAGDGLRTGTYPFMSHAIIKPQPDPHEAIHDIESFWWILVHLAMTRAGPGGLRRLITKPPETDEDLIISQQIYNYFDGPPGTLSASKAAVFSVGYEKALRTVENNLLANFHSYFEPLKGIILKWWKILYSGYEFSTGYERLNIHHHVLTMLKEAMADPALTRPHAQMEVEENRRISYYEEAKKAITEKRIAEDLTASPVAIPSPNRRVSRVPASDTDSSPSAPKRIRRR